MNRMTNDNVLQRIHGSADVKQLTSDEQKRLCAELRQVMIDTVAQTGGHLASNLGVVELTVALHHHFDLPRDQIVWDVGHQCYAHKLLTGRQEQFATLRQEGGLSGFPNPDESEYDSFVVGHSSTSVSLANGLAKAHKLTGDENYVVAVIGDGALTGGLAYEGLSNAGRSHDRLIVILNDNRMSISRNVGFVARHLADLRARPAYVRAKNRLARILSHLPLLGKPLYRALVNTKIGLKRTLYRSSTLFEEMGYYYLGPIDGHDLVDLSYALETAKTLSQPVLLHVVTVKGKGYAPAEKQPDKYHGVGRFAPETGETDPPCESFSSVFGDTLFTLGQADSRICAITAAMGSGTGLEAFERDYAKRCFDVGIAEEHAVTFASGLAKGGALPVFAVYSTFVQRAYDQLLNDTALNRTHVVLALDRAGLVPDDGNTHQGIYDVPMLSTIPNTVIYAPSSYAELRLHLKQALYDCDGIAAVRYPKGQEDVLAEQDEPDYGAFRLDARKGSRVLLVTYGRLYYQAVRAAEQLAEKGIAVSVLKLNRIRPIDPACVEAARDFERVIFCEEGSPFGGAGQQFGLMLQQAGFGGRYILRGIEEPPAACKPTAALHRLGLDADGMVKLLENNDG